MSKRELMPEEEYLGVLIVSDSDRRNRLYCEPFAFDTMNSAPRPKLWSVDATKPAESIVEMLKANQMESRIVRVNLSCSDY